MSRCGLLRLREFLFEVSFYETLENNPKVEVFSYHLNFKIQNSKEWLIGGFEHSRPISKGNAGPSLLQFAVYVSQMGCQSIIFTSTTRLLFEGGFFSPTLESQVACINKWIIGFSMFFLIDV